MKRKAMAIGTAVIFTAVLVCVLIFGLSHTGTPSYEVTFFDVGKGDCIFINSGSRYMMIDAGYEDTAGVVQSYMKDKGIRALDALILTHYDKDHAGGVPELLSSVPVGIMYAPDYESEKKFYSRCMSAAERNHVKQVFVDEKQEFSFGDLLLDIYPSEIVYDEEEKNDNDLSLTITMTKDEDSWYFAGDLEEEGLDMALERGLAHCDILKVPHHGAYEDNSEEFFAAVSPQLAIITDGYDKEADEEVVSLLSEQGAECYRTCEAGSVTITCNGSGEYSVRTETQEER